MLHRLRIPSSAPPSAPFVASHFDLREEQGLRGDLGKPRCTDFFEWLFAGGLAHPSGGIAGWRDRRTGRLSDEYPEISGYFLSAAVFAEATGAEPVIRAADWLTARIEGDELASRRADGGAIYNFDLGIVAAGLIKYGVREGRAPAVTAGIRAASCLRDQVNQYGHLSTNYLLSGDVNNLTTNDFKIAYLRHWLAIGDPPIVEGTSPALSVERAPSPETPLACQLS